MVVDTNQHKITISKVSSAMVGDTFFLSLYSFWVTLFICVLTISSKAQFLDSINYHLHSKPELTGSIVSRSSFITSNLARIEGYRVGISFNDAVEFGIAYNRLKTPIYLKRSVYNFKGEVITSDVQLKINYFSLYTEYVFYKRNKWILTAPLFIGAGHASLISTLPNERLVNEERVGCFIYEPYITAEYMLIKYVSAEAGVGYRLGTLEKKMGLSINSPMYIFVINVYYYSLYKDIKAKLTHSK